MFDLIKTDSAVLEKKSEEYTAMVKTIEENIPLIYQASSHFGKTQSQFMDNLMTVSHSTPLRNARQTLAEINKSLSALREAQFNMNKKKLLIKRLERDLLTETDDLKKEEMKLEVDFESSNLSNTMLYVEGAIRAVANYTAQYKQILKNAGYTEMSEIDFEKEEESYHIQKAFEQAICAARSRGGLIDEGNHIYFYQIGINGAMAQDYVNRFFEQEKAALSRGGVLTSEFQRSFLKDMSECFKDCSKSMAEARGMIPLNTATVLQGKSNLYQIRGSV